MPEEKSDNSTKRLVQILVIVGIGIPVLVELMTLFNLINVQVFEDEKDANSQGFDVEDVRGFGEGDTLFADQESAVLIDQLRVKVSAQQWRFALGMTSIDSISQNRLQIRVDSLSLQSDKMLLGNDSSSWEVRQSKPVKIYGEWDLPNGDIPTKLFISMYQQIAGDSTLQVSRAIPLDKIPVRYNQE
ncbi:hypothetical protein [Fodinibius sp. AD559]|uniref:hypothetical protein n=1 Tax=Fodinibius sp. AD559 TaxID=3424179 RepID=UPI004046D35A